MTVGQLFIRLRYFLNDMSKTKYSDYELLIFLNEVLSMVNTALIDIDSHIVKKDADITFDGDGKCALPSDFNGIVALLSAGEEIPITDFSIIGGYLYSSSGADSLRYRYSFPILTAVGDTLPIPDAFVDDVRGYMQMLIGKEASGPQLKSLIKAEVIKKAVGRDYAYLDREPPFTL